jgi:uncharacterized protein YbjT (DUF2867 family)
MNTPTDQTILLVGSTGMLGSRIAHHLLNEPATKLRLLTRKSGNDGKTPVLQSMLNRGAEIVVGDLTDAASLNRVTEGVDVIVSAVQGNSDVIVGGQVALAEAAQRNGVRRILPSDFGLDLFKATPGEHPAFNARATADTKIATLGMEHIHVLQGAFMSMLAPGSPLIDYDKGFITFWGEGTHPIEMTTIDDTARMTARIALDRSVSSGKFAFCGDKLSFQQAADIAEEKIGKPFARHSLGTESDLRAALAEKMKSDPAQAVMLAYQLYMLNGQTKLDNLQSDRYPDIKMQRFADFLVDNLSESVTNKPDGRT